MVSTVDLLGLALGAVYAVFIPILVFLGLRKRFGLEIRYLFLGVVAMIAARSVQPLLAMPLQILVEQLITKAPSLPIMLIEFFAAIIFPLTSALANLTTGLFILAAAVDKNKNGRAALAFAIGAFGWLSFQRGWTNLVFLHRADTLNSSGAEAAFGHRAHVTPRLLVSEFGMGIPDGVGAIAGFALYVAVMLVLWDSWIRRRWGWVGSVYLLIFGLAALSALIHVGGFVMDELAPTGGALASVIASRVYETFVGIAVAIVLYRKWPLFLRMTSQRSPEVPTQVDVSSSAHEGEAFGIFKAWKDQARRD